MNSLLLYNCWAFDINCTKCAYHDLANLYGKHFEITCARNENSPNRILIVNIMLIIGYQIGTVQHMPRNPVFLHLLIASYLVHNQESLVVYNYSNRNL